MLDPHWERLTKREQQLVEEKKRLLESRKQRIGELAEKFDLLTLSDAVLAGAFFGVAQAFKTNASQIKVWEEQGARFCGGGKSKKLEEIETRAS